MSPIIAVRLKKGFGLREGLIGYVFAGGFLSYLLSIPLVTFMCKRLHRRITIASSLFLAICGIILTGPS